MWNKDGGGKEENMSEGLLKIFIKDYKNVKDIKVRENYGIFAGIVGIICNLILFACKFFAGIITGSVSISADAFNNLSDAGSSIVTLAGFKMAGGYRPSIRTWQNRIYRRNDCIGSYYRNGN